MELYKNVRILLVFYIHPDHQKFCFSPDWMLLLIFNRCVRNPHILRHNLQSRIKRNKSNRRVENYADHQVPILSKVICNIPSLNFLVPNLT